MSRSIEALLAGTPLFADAEGDELAVLAARARMVTLAPRALLFSRGDPGDRLYVLASGLVRIGAMSPDGREVTYGLIRPGQVFGEIAVLDGGPRSADASAVLKSQLAVIERTDLMAFLGRRPAHAFRLLNILCDRVRSADGLLEDLFFLAAPSRLAKHLILLGTAVGESGESKGGEGKDGAAGNVTIRMSQQQVADYVGVSRELVNKLLAKWEQAGLVGLWRGQITLKDLEALDALIAPE
jgi:CRP-like cAMP-binding protein